MTTLPSKDFDSTAHIMILLGNEVCCRKNLKRVSVFSGFL